AVLLVIQAGDLRRESQLLMSIVVMDSHACPRFGLDGEQFYVTWRVLNLLRRPEYTDSGKTLLRKIGPSRRRAKKRPDVIRVRPRGESS
ncbi:MAG: hypothetical protein KA150_08210, partial [Propionivibrio sp.]|nr:hypothetical protein [Propionivibrio sp.]